MGGSGRPSARPSRQASPTSQRPETAPSTPPPSSRPPSRRWSPCPPSSIWTASPGAALVVGATPSLSPAAVRDILIGTGEYPDGTFAEGGCGGGGQWAGDPDGIAEPLVNALKAAQAGAGGLGGVPTIAP